MSISRKMQQAIYKVDRQYFEDNMTCFDIIETIIQENNISQKLHSKYKSIETNDIYPGFNTLFYFRPVPLGDIWIDFLRSTLTSTIELEKIVRQDVAYILFFYDDEDIFAVTGGAGYHGISRYCEVDFGMHILARLLDATDNSIRVLKNRTLIGSVLSATRFFRRTSSLMDEKEFGSLVKEVNAAIKDQSTIVDKLGIAPNKASKLKRPINCMAKSSFKLQKSMDISSLHKLLTKLKSLYYEHHKFDLSENSSFTLLNNRNVRQKAEIAKAQYAFKSLVYEKCLVNEVLEIDVMHQDFNPSYAPTKYRIIDSHGVILEEERATFDSQQDLHELFNSLDDTIKSDKIICVNYLENIIIQGLDENNLQLFSGKLFSYLHGDVTVDNCHYYVIDGQWFSVTDRFLSSLNMECENTLRKSINSNLLLEKWDPDPNIDEDTYITQYKDNDNCLVLHKQLFKNIELCDLLLIGAETIYFIHIKRGFNHTMRSLALQVLDSSRVLTESILARNDQELGEFYDRIPENEKLKISREKFVQNILNSHITKQCILAFFDDAIHERTLDDISKFKSSVAKMAVIMIRKEMKSYDLAFSVTPILKKV